MEIPLLGQSNAQARASQPQEPDTTEPIDVVTAFYVVKLKNGQAGVIPDINIDLKTERSAHPHDTIGLCRIALNDPYCYDDFYEAGDTLEVETGILVYLLPHGEALADTDLDTPVTPRREPTVDEIVMASEVVMRDMDVIFHAPHLAQQVVQAQMAMGRAVQEQMEKERIKTELQQAQQMQNRRPK